MSVAPAPAWFPDPNDPAALRWWDGVQWTDHVSPVPAPVAAVPQLVVAPITLGGGAAQAHVTAADPELLQLQREQLEVERARLEHERETSARAEEHHDGYRRLMRFQWGMSLLGMARMFIRR